MKLINERVKTVGGSTIVSTPYPPGDTAPDPEPEGKKQKRTAGAEKDLVQKEDQAQQKATELPL